MRTRDGGLRVHERHHVLELVAESIRAARLVDGRAAPNAAGERLIEQPSIHHHVEAGLRRLHDHRRQDSLPGSELAIELGRRLARGAVAAQELAHRILALVGTEQRHDLTSLAWLDVDRALERDARIDGRARGLVHDLAGLTQRRWIARVAMTPQELAAIRCPGVDRLAQRRERDHARELWVGRVPRQNRAELPIVMCDDLVLRVLALDA